MYNTSNSPITARRNSNLSPQKISPSLVLSSQCRRADQSPRRTNGYTVHHEQKLKVFIKFKPPSIPQQYLNVTYLNDKQVQIQRQSTNNKIYSYDRVFHENVSSDKVFLEGCSDIVDKMVQQGQNGLIFVYGHTGTGKTYTMGLIDKVDGKSKGIVPQTIRYLFRMKQRVEQKNGRMEICLSFNEIYMDEVYDMLDFESDKKLQIRQWQSTKEPYIENNISIAINTIEQAYQLLNIGLEKRRVGEQKINKRSSRGHGLITITISLPNGKSCRLCFVDLAGSQRVKQSESVGKALKEAVHINTSLSALQSLLMNIDEQSVRMYRGNKLTRLLQPFLESGKIRLFVTSNYQNTQPFQFAKRCKGIKFMEKQIIQPSPAVQRVGSGTSPIKVSNTGQERTIPSRHSTLSSQVQKLQKQNKILTQLLTNSIVIISKINKLVFNLVLDQNVRSQFSLATDYNLAMLDSSIEQKINTKINQLQTTQQDIIDKCTKLAKLYDLNSTGNQKEKDDSVNTSASNNMNFQNSKTNIIGPQLQTLINCLPTQADQLHGKINQIGFGIFQTVKNLAYLCDYRNVFKKQVFTYAIKEQLLQGRNKQLEIGITTLLKHIKSNQNINLVTKITKQLKQLGIQLNTNTKQSKTKPATTNKKQCSTRVRQTQASYSPISRSIPVHHPPTPTHSHLKDRGMERQREKQRQLEMGRNYIIDAYQGVEDEDELFGQTRNENRNVYNTYQEKKRESKGEGKGRQKYQTTQNLGRSGRKTGGLILIEDL